jgi:hypothetical protein
VLGIELVTKEGYKRKTNHWATQNIHHSQASYLYLTFFNDHSLLIHYQTNHIGLAF